MDNKMTQAEKFTAIRAEAKAKFTNVEGAFQVAVDTYAIETANGWAKITVQAVKDTEFDAAQAQADYFEEKAVKEAAKQAKVNAKEAAAAVREAEKAKNAKA